MAVLCVLCSGLIKTFIFCFFPLQLLPQHCDPTHRPGTAGTLPWIPHLIRQPSSVSVTARARNNDKMLCALMCFLNVSHTDHNNDDKGNHHHSIPHHHHHHYHHQNLHRHHILVTISCECYQCVLCSPGVLPSVPTLIVGKRTP